MTEVWYYKGVHKVKVVTETEGYWIVEALEAFEDEDGGKNVMVEIGERRIVQSNLVHKQKYLPPPIKEHTYELQLEKKLKTLVAGQEKKNQTEP